LDLAKKTMGMCMLCDDGDPARYSGVKTDATGRNRLAALLRRTDAVGMEACAFLLTRFLRKKVGCAVYILNPGELQVIWKSTGKTDKEDARKIATLIRRDPPDELPLVALPSEEEEELRRLVSAKQFFTKERMRLLNRLHALFVRAGIVDVKKSRVKTKAGRAKRMSDLPAGVLFLAQGIDAMIDAVNGQIDEIKPEIAGEVRKNELSKYVLSISGIGMDVAATFLAYVGDGSHFGKAKELARSVAFTPTLDCSGETNRYGHIPQNKDCRALRSIMLQSVRALLKVEDGGPLRAQFFQLHSRMGKTKSAVAVARKMMTLMWLLVRHREYYADASKEYLARKFRYYKVDYEECKLKGS
jgi:transposase